MSPPSVDDVELVDASPRTFGWPVVAASAGLGAGAMLIAVFMLGVRIPAIGAPQSGAGAPVASATASSPLALEGCAVTLPDPAFSAPSPYPSSPADSGDAWFGTRDLWTKLQTEGEVWDAASASLPIGIKTFWWSANWPGMTHEQEPAITVVATRLDAPGSVRVDHGTNAAADDLEGEAMLVGIEIPAAGCWQLTGQYQGAVLSYVVWITDE